MRKLDLSYFVTNCYCKNYLKDLEIVYLSTNLDDEETFRLILKL